MFGSRFPTLSRACKSFFRLLLDPSSISESVIYEVWRIKIPKKTKFFLASFAWLVSTLDRLAWKMALLMGSFCCIL